MSGSGNIPLVDFRDYAAGGDLREAFVEALGEGLEAFGFVNVEGHGIEPELIDEAYRLAGEAFALPDAAKQRYETPEDGRQRGYTSYGVEHARDHGAPDLKEFWHVGRHLGADHPLHRSGDVPPNQFPEEIAGFDHTFLALFERLEGFANDLLEAVGAYLGQPPSTFRDMVRDGNSVLRVIHYPDLGGPPAPGAVRAAQHEDINLLTVLPASTRPGLEILTRDGRWMPVQAPPGAMVCDTGDMMARITGGRIPATTHRVVNPEGADGGRLSMPFFLHPHPDIVLRPLLGEGAPAIRARDFLRQRLQEIGVA